MDILGHQVLRCKLSLNSKYLKSIPQSCNYLVCFKSSICFGNCFWFWKLIWFITIYINYVTEKIMQYKCLGVCLPQRFAWLDVLKNISCNTSLFLSICFPKMSISPITLNVSGIPMSGLWKTRKYEILRAQNLPMKEFPHVMQQPPGLTVFFSVLINRG